MFTVKKTLLSAAFFGVAVVRAQVVGVDADTSLG